MSVTWLSQGLLSTPATGGAGNALGRGEKLADIEANMGMVIEGISTTKAAYELAQELDVYMPITQAIYKVIYQNWNIKEAIYEIMNNEFKAENEWTSF